MKYLNREIASSSTRSLPARGAWIEIQFAAVMEIAGQRRSPHGERGLKYVLLGALPRFAVGRSPHGERGLKSASRVVAVAVGVSLPARGAWIEISRLREHLRLHRPSLPARGAWIEILWPGRSARNTRSRSPHGERGLKSLFCRAGWTQRMSLPARGAWIEIPPLRWPFAGGGGSLPARGAWIEILSASLYSLSPALCRSPHGERGLKSDRLPNDPQPEISRSPHGERGLKLE